MARSQLDTEQLDHNLIEGHVDTDTPYSGGPTGGDTITRNSANTAWQVRRDTITNVDPSASDDSTQGYVIGSRWINTGTNDEFVCVSAVAAAAVWVQTSPSGGAPHNIISATHGNTAAPAHTTETLSDVLAYNGSNWTARRNTSDAVVDPAVSNDNTQGYAVGSWWLNTTEDALWICADAATGAAVWYALTNTAIRALSKTTQYGFSDNSNPYVEVNSTTWTTVGHFQFFGTTVFTPTVWEVTGSRNGVSGNAEARLVDINTSLIVASISWSTDTIAIHTTNTVTNLPVAPSVFAVQIRKDAGNAKSARLHHTIFE